jgi:probable F420-dependent oxidoreductase
MELDCLSFGGPLGAIPELARGAEEIGFSGIWFTESAHNPFVTSAAAALATDRMLIGTGIAVAFPRSPMVTAQATWDLAEATGGRFVLGLGSQVKAHVERRFSTPFSQPAARLREYVLSVRAIWRAFQGEEKLAFDGDFYRFSLLTEFFSPGPIEHPDIPIFLSAVNPHMLRVAGEVADGVHVHPFHSKRYLEEVIRPGVAAGAGPAGRSLDDVALAVPVFVITADSDADAERQRSSVRRQLAFYGSTPAYRAVFERHGWEDTADQLRALQRRGDDGAMAGCITDEMLAVFAVTASWDGLAGALLERYAGLADRVFPYGTAGDWQRHPERAERWRAVAGAVRAGRAQAGPGPRR